MREAECEHERGHGRGRERELERVSLRLFLAVRCAALRCAALVALLLLFLRCWAPIFLYLPVLACRCPPATLHAPPCPSTTLPPTQVSDPGTHLGTTWDRLGIDGLVGSRAIPGDAAAWANDSVTRRLSSTPACRAQADAALHPLE